MPGGVKPAGGGDEHVIAEGDRGAAQNHAVVVGIKVFPDPDVISVVAPERRSDKEGGADLAEQLPDDGGALFFLGGTQLVIGVTQILAGVPFPDQIQVMVGVVKHPAKHFFFFRHKTTSTSEIIRCQRTRVFSVSSSSRVSWAEK